MNLNMIGSLFTENIVQFLTILVPFLLVLTAVLFIYCRKGEIISYITGKPYEEKSESDLRERRFCDRRVYKRKKGDRRRDERRSTGAHPA